jgi:hypothetical protein
VIFWDEYPCSFPTDCICGGKGCLWAKNKGSYRVLEFKKDKKE